MRRRGRIGAARAGHAAGCEHGQRARQPPTRPARAAANRSSTAGKSRRRRSSSQRNMGNVDAATEPTTPRAPRERPRKRRSDSLRAAPGGRRRAAYAGCPQRRRPRLARTLRRRRVPRKRLRRVRLVQRRLPSSINYARDCA
jgi:hypothetical protein